MTGFFTEYLENILWNEDGTGQLVILKTRFSPCLERYMYDLLADTNHSICLEVQAFDTVENFCLAEYVPSANEGVPPECAPEPEPEPESESFDEAVPFPLLIREF